VRHLICVGKQSPSYDVFPLHMHITTTRAKDILAAHGIVKEITDANSISDVEKAIILSESGRDVMTAKAQDHNERYLMPVTSY